MFFLNKDTGMENSENVLESIIEELIKSKREGDFWDFKEKPYDNKASLLHDILCLSNSLHRGNRYLIIGVSDPSEGALIIGLGIEDVNRKKQADYIDFLSNKNFAGDSRPEIEMHTIKIDEKEIDVIIIFDRPEKPYYLLNDYSDGEKHVKANYIYTRTIDRNTPIDRSADIGIIEKMWKQKFGIDQSPLERMKQLLLKPQLWSNLNLDNDKPIYCRDFPEFHMEYSQPERKGNEGFGYFYLDEQLSFGKICFKYHSTTLFEMEYVSCDGLRVYLPVPKIGNIAVDEGQIYFYYIENSLEGALLVFLNAGELDRLSTGRNNYNPFLIFKDESEHKEFEDYVIAQRNILDKINATYKAEEAKQKIEKDNFTRPFDPIFVDKLIQLKRSYDYQNK